MAKRVGKYMESNHTKFLYENVPVSAEVQPDGKIKVGFKSVNNT